MKVKKVAPEKDCVALCRIVSSAGKVRTQVVYGEPGYPGELEIADNESVHAIVIDADDMYTGPWRAVGDSLFAHWAAGLALPVWAMELYMEHMDDEYGNCEWIADDARFEARRK